MENIKLAIVTDDREYGKAMALALINVYKSFIVKVYMTEEFLYEKDEYYKKYNEGIFTQLYDLILWDGEEARNSFGGNIIHMASKPSMIGKDYNGRRFSLYKYCDGETLARDLFDIYGFLTGRHPARIHNGGMGFIVFSSWSGGTGCSSLAMAVGQELTRFHGKRVFYLSLEEVESTGNFIRGCTSTKPLGQYIYKLLKDRNSGFMGVREETSTYMPFMESYVIKDDYGIEAFAPTVGRNPLCYMKDDDFFALIESIYTSGRYDVLIVDTGSNLSDTAIACLQMAEKICLVSRMDEEQRCEQYINYLMLRCGENTVDKIIRVNNMSKGNMTINDAEELMIPIDFAIEKRRFYSMDQGVKKIHLEGDFGHKISLITKNMTEPVEIAN
jgi:MinD-like ATPase involved in chromosome partitioning or flagellar assembly